MRHKASVNSGAIAREALQTKGEFWRHGAGLIPPAPLTSDQASFVGVTIQTAKNGDNAHIYDSSTNCKSSRFCD